MSTLVASRAFVSRQREGLSRPGYLFIWVFLIVVFEGAIRKWGSGAATIPLLLLRDLLALYSIYYAWSTGGFRRNKGPAVALLAWSCVLVAWGLLQCISGVTNLVMMMIGLRFWLLYIWFAVAIASTMNESDFRTAVRVIVGTLILMAPLAVAQFLQPPGALINSSLDGDEDSVFTAVAGVVRTTGTFSFTTAYVMFVAIAAPLVLALFGARKRTPAQVGFVVVAFAAFVIAATVSGSRTAVIYSVFILGAYFIAWFMLARGKSKITALFAIVVGVSVLALLLYIFSDAIASTTERFQQASEAEDIGERLLAIFIGEPYVYTRSTWLGYGLGVGSSLGTYVSVGTTSYLFGETEAGRILLEGGFIGYLYTFIKVILIVYFLARSLRLAFRLRSAYPFILWLMISYGLLTWPAIGQLTPQPMLGIAIALGLLVFRFPRIEFFPSRSSRS